VNDEITPLVGFDDSIYGLVPRQGNPRKKKKMKGGGCFFFHKPSNP